MSNTLKKLVITPVLLSVTVLAILTLPLLLLSKKPITIQLKKEPVFQGQLRDISTPYLGLASVISLGAGVASAAFSGWRISSRKSSQVEVQLSNLTRNIQEKEAQIEALQRSELKIADPQLKAFLEQADLAKPVIASHQTNQSPMPNFQPALSSTSLPVQAVEELNWQLQEIMTQMASVQAALTATPTTGNTDQASSYIIKS